MPDILEFDLAALKCLLQKPLDLNPRRFKTLVAEIIVSPEIIAAVRAGEFGVIGSIVWPNDAAPAFLACERN